MLTRCKPSVARVNTRIIPSPDFELPKTDFGELAPDARRRRRCALRLLAALAVGVARCQDRRLSRRRRSRWGFFGDSPGNPVERPVSRAGAVPPLPLLRRRRQQGRVPRHGRHPPSPANLQIIEIVFYFAHAWTAFIIKRYA